MHFSHTYFILTPQIFTNLKQICLRFIIDVILSLQFALYYLYCCVVIIFMITSRSEISPYNIFKYFRLCMILQHRMIWFVKVYNSCNQCSPAQFMQNPFPPSFSTSNGAPQSGQYPNSP